MIVNQTARPHSIQHGSVVVEGREEASGCAGAAPQAHLGRREVGAVVASQSALPAQCGPTASTRACCNKPAEASTSQPSHKPTQATRKPAQATSQHKRACMPARGTRGVVVVEHVASQVPRTPPWAPEDEESLEPESEPEAEPDMDTDA